MTSPQEQIIFSKVFINDSVAQDDIDSQEIKAGDQLPLSITWREAVLRKDGKYQVKAYLQKEGKNAQDISLNIYSGKSYIILTESQLREEFQKFDNAHNLNGYDVYVGEIDRKAVLSKDKIEENRTQHQAPKAA